MIPHEPDAVTASAEAVSSFRRARPEDAERIAEIMSTSPAPEIAGLTGNKRQARTIAAAFARIPGAPASRQGLRETTLAVLDGEVAGFIQTRIGGDIQFSPTVIAAALPGLLLTGLRTLGPAGLVRGFVRMRARGRLDMDPPAGAYNISELHVHPDVRGRGIGGALLDWAENDARQRGCSQMSLATTTSNPARRLYERHGFRVTQTRTDADYESYTGIAGRVMMIRDLD